eukprot:4099494-Amphidinium_carterae.1
MGLGWGLADASKSLDFAESFVALGVVFSGDGSAYSREQNVQEGLLASLSRTAFAPSGNDSRGRPRNAKRRKLQFRSQQSFGRVGRVAASTLNSSSPVLVLSDSDALNLKVCG